LALFCWLCFIRLLFIRCFVTFRWLFTFVISLADCVEISFAIRFICSVYLLTIWLNICWLGWLLFVGCLLLLFDLLADLFSCCCYICWLLNCLAVGLLAVGCYLLADWTVGCCCCWLLAVDGCYLLLLLALLAVVYFGCCLVISIVVNV
jgi:hypothetical protein